MSDRKTPKKPAPGFKMRYESFVLGNSFKVRATLGLQREIDRVGGFDRYIYYTPEDKLVDSIYSPKFYSKIVFYLLHFFLTPACALRLRSQLARSLRLRMLERTERYPQAVPPPLNKRNPQPVPKNLTKGLEPVEVCILNKFVYLG